MSGGGAAGPPRIGFVGFGEAGPAVAEGIVQAGIASRCHVPSASVLPHVSPGTSETGGTLAASVSPRNTGA